MIVLVDGHYFLHRTLKAGEHIHLRTSTGIPSGGVFGVIKSIRFALSRFPEASRCIVAWDNGRSTRRQGLLPEYKDNRVPKTPAEVEEHQWYFEMFRDQKARLQAALPLFGIRCVELENREADDVIGWASRSTDEHCVIITEDRDLIQLVSPNTSIFRPRFEQHITWENFSEEMKMPKHLFLLSKAMNGDTSDNIPGIEKVGETTVKRVIERMAELLPQPVEGMRLSEVMQNACALQAETDTRNRKRYGRVAEAEERIRENLDLMDISKEVATFTTGEIDAIQQSLVGDERMAEMDLMEFCAAMEFNSFFDGLAGDPNWSNFIDPFRRLR